MIKIKLGATGRQLVAAGQTFDLNQLAAQVGERAMQRQISAKLKKLVRS